MAIALTMRLINAVGKNLIVVIKFLGATVLSVFSARSLALTHTNPSLRELLLWSLSQSGVALSCYCWLAKQLAL